LKGWPARVAKQEAGIDKRFTIPGLRYTLTDLVRRANVEVRRAFTLGHVTEDDAVALLHGRDRREARGDRRRASARAAVGTPAG
jgi:hypothetical protein